MIYLKLIKLIITLQVVIQSNFRNLVLHDMIVSVGYFRVIKFKNFSIEWKIEHNITPPTNL